MALHLGSQQTVDGAASMHVDHRSKAMAKSISPFLRSVRSVKGVYGFTMLQFGEALGPPSLLYNMHTLFNVNAAALTRLTSKLLTLYRVCINTTSKLQEKGWEHVSKHHTWFLAAKLDVQHRIMISRLKMWPRVLAAGPCNLMRLIDMHFRYKTLFAQNVLKDFVWLHSLSDADDLPDPAAGLSPWFEFIAIDDLAAPSRFKHLIGVAARRQLALSQDDRALRVWRRNLVKSVSYTHLTLPTISSV